MKMMKKVDTTWSPTLAYVVGVIAADGNLSSDGRHINITSKDGDWLTMIRNSLGLTSKIGRKARASSSIKKYHVLQIGDKHFYEFLMDLGLTPNKSKTIGRLNIPSKFFADFLRGCIDGDGSITISDHPESKHKQLRIRLCSASLTFLEWIQNEILQQTEVLGGWIYKIKKHSFNILSYGKADSTKILNFMYYQSDSLRLERKFKLGLPFMGK